MKKVEAVFESFKLDQVREALAKKKIPRITIFEVKGSGCHQGKLKAYRGVRYVEDSAEIKIEIVLDDDDAERIAQLIVDTLQTGNLGEGEVSIVPIEQIFRLRFGQHGHRVPGWAGEAAVPYLNNNTMNFRSYLKALRRKLHETG